MGVPRSFQSPLRPWPLTLSLLLLLLTAAVLGDPLRTASKNASEAVKETGPRPEEQAKEEGFIVAGPGGFKPISLPTTAVQSVDISDLLENNTQFLSSDDVRARKKRQTADVWKAGFAALDSDEEAVVDAKMVKRRQVTDAESTESSTDSSTYPSTDSSTSPSPEQTATVTFPDETGSTETFEGPTRSFQFQQTDPPDAVFSFYEHSTEASESPRLDNATDSEDYKSSELPEVDTVVAATTDVPGGQDKDASVPVVKVSVEDVSTRTTRNDDAVEGSGQENADKGGETTVEVASGLTTTPLTVDLISSKEDSAAEGEVTRPPGFDYVNPRDYGFSNTTSASFEIYPNDEDDDAGAVELEYVDMKQLGFTHPPTASAEDLVISEDGKLVTAHSSSQTATTTTEAKVRMLTRTPSLGEIISSNRGLSTPPPADVTSTEATTAESTPTTTPKEEDTVPTTAAEVRQTTSTAKSGEDDATPARGDLPDVLPTLADSEDTPRPKSEPAPEFTTAQGDAKTSAAPADPTTVPEAVVQVQVQTSPQKPVDDSEENARLQTPEDSVLFPENELKKDVDTSATTTTTPTSVIDVESTPENQVDTTAVDAVTPELLIETTRKPSDVQPPESVTQLPEQGHTPDTANNNTTTTESDVKTTTAASTADSETETSAPSTGAPAGDDKATSTEEQAETTDSPLVDLQTTDKIAVQATAVDGGKTTPEDMVEEKTAKEADATTHEPVTTTPDQSAADSTAAKMETTTTAHVQTTTSQIPVDSTEAIEFGTTTPAADVDQTETATDKNEQSTTASVDGIKAIVFPEHTSSPALEDTTTTTSTPINEPGSTELQPAVQTTDSEAVETTPVQAINKTTTTGSIDATTSLPELIQKDETATPEPSEQTATNVSSKTTPETAVKNTTSTFEPTATEPAPESTVKIPHTSTPSPGPTKGEESSGNEDSFDGAKSTPQNDQQTDNHLDDDDRGRPGSIGVQPTTVGPRLESSMTSRPEYARGPKGDKGEPGPPGVCSQDCSSFYSYSQGPPRLSDEDIARIASYPGVKAARSDVTGFQGTTALPPYNPSVHRYTTKGEKGEKGDRGPIGPPGQPGTVVYANSNPTSSGTGSASPGVVRVYSTSTELFASAGATPVGQLAFSVSSQQLYIRVNNGWREVNLGEFHSSVETRPPVTAPSEELRVPPRPILEPQDQVKVVEEQPEIRTLAPPREREQEDQERLLQQQHRHQQEQDRRLQQQQQQYPQQEHPRVHNRDKVLHLIALNEPFNGNMKGIRGADFQCYKQARQAGYRTTFRAFISSRVQDLLKIVHFADRDTSVVNSRGEQIYGSWADVFTGASTSQAPIYSFAGQDIFNSAAHPDQYIWHGSDESGLRVDGGYCEAWRSADSYAHGMASALLRGRPLITEAEQVSCRRELIVLCVENMSKYNIDLRLARRMQWKHK